MPRKVPSQIKEVVSTYRRQGYNTLVEVEYIASVGFVRVRLG